MAVESVKGFISRRGGITRRWLVNVMAVFAAVLFFIEVFASVFYYNYYYSSVGTTAASYAQSFNVLSMAAPGDFAAKAREYCENFEYKEKMEIQILDSSGKALVSTTGFPVLEETMPDYSAAVKSSAGVGRWHGISSSGQHIFAGTYLLTDTGSGSNGAVRWVIATDRINRHIFFTLLAFILVGLFVLGFSVISGLYFVNSIVKPLQLVTNTTRKIALGDFNSRIALEDESEIGEICDSINYMAGELGQAEAMKNDFISSVSHELRTPLTAIRGWGETLKMAANPEDELITKGIDVILHESERLSGLVEDLLDFSRMQSGHLSMNLREIQLIDTLDEAVYMYRELARQQNIDLSFVRPRVSPVVMGDPDRLKQVFINVVDNAIKYNKPGGQVLIETIMEEGCVRITVTDTGVGIPAADVDRCKEKFYKSNKTVRGSGIGLAVADEIMKQHQGLLFLESTEGVGTTVTIVLPTIEPAGQTAASVTEPPAPAQDQLAEFQELPPKEEH